MPRRGRQIEEFDFKVRTFRGEHWIAAVHVSGPVIFKGYLRLELKGSREDADEAAAAIRKRIFVGCLSRLSRDWRRVSTARKLPHVSFHALRHTNASVLVSKGMDILTISRRLRHSKPSVTLDVYGI